MPTGLPKWQIVGKIGGAALAGSVMVSGYAWQVSAAWVTLLAPKHISPADAHKTSISGNGVWCRPGAGFARIGSSFAVEMVSTAVCHKTGSSPRMTNAGYLGAFSVSTTVAIAWAAIQTFREQTATQ